MTFTCTRRFRERFVWASSSDSESRSKGAGLGTIGGFGPTCRLPSSRSSWIDLWLNSLVIFAERPRSSEEKFHGELHDARVECGRDRAETGRAEHRIRRAEIRRVQQVEYLG